MQQINLYTDAFKPKKVILPLEQMIAIPLLILLLLVAASAGLKHSLNQSEQDIADLRLKNDDMAQRLKVLEGKANRLRKDESLVAANKRLDKKLKARQRMIDLLDTVVVIDDDGFSALLLSLARQNVEKLWLNEIYIGASGKEMRIQGKTLSAELVPIYLQQLRQEDSFIGRNFTVFELEKNKDRTSVLDFVLKSEEHLVQDSLLLSRMETGQAIKSYAESKDIQNTKAEVGLP